MDVHTQRQYAIQQAQIEQEDLIFRQQDRDMEVKIDITRYFVECITPFRQDVKDAYCRGEREYKFPIKIQVSTNDPKYRGGRIDFDDQHIQYIFMQDDILCRIYWMNVSDPMSGQWRDYLRIYSVIFEDQIKPPKKTRSCLIS